MTVAKTLIYVNHHITEGTAGRLRTTGLMLREDGLDAEAENYLWRYQEQRKHLDALAQFQTKFGSIHNSVVIETLNWLLVCGWKPPTKWAVQTITETLEDDSEE